MTSSVEPLDVIPIWLIIPLTVMLGLIAAEVGFRLGKWWQQRSQNAKDPSLGGIVGAVLGLLAFLLAFLTGAAADRFNARRELVVTDATAISTAELRSRYLPEPYRSTSGALYKQYVDVRVAATRGLPLEQATAQAEAIQAALWDDVVTLVQVKGDSESAVVYMDALNHMMAVHTERVTAVMARIPSTVLIGIFLITLLALLLVGFNNSYENQRSAIAMLVLLLVFSSVIFLIVDLDRPNEGFLRISQQPMLDLQQSLDH